MERENFFSYNSISTYIGRKQLNYKNHLATVIEIIYFVINPLNIKEC